MKKLKKLANFQKKFEKSVDINFKVWYINNAIAEKGLPLNLNLVQIHVFE